MNNLVKYLFLLCLLLLSCTVIKQPENKKTKSNYTGKIKFSENITIYFTNPPARPIMENDLIDLINNHNKDFPLDICIYGFDNERIISALENVISKGVHVRFIGNKDGNGILNEKNGYYYEGYYRIAAALDKQFPIPGKKRINFPLESGFEDFKLINNSGIMHHKFILITDDKNRKYIFTGSANFTETGFTRNNNNSLLIKNTDIFNSYKTHFEYLLDLTSDVNVNKKQSFVIDNLLLEILFIVPDNLDKTEDIIINHITQASTNINFMIFTFSHEEMGSSLINMQKNGIKINGIFDQAQLDCSHEEYLTYNDISCKIDGNYHKDPDSDHGGKLHHKIMIIDSNENDALIITGSSNWSENAFKKNHENMILIHSKDISSIYKKEFEKRWKEGRLIKKQEMGDAAEYQDVVINEIMWMGSRKYYDISLFNDEFIELRNMTDKNINLSGWKIENAGINNIPIFLDDIFLLKNSYLVIKNLPNSISAFNPENMIINTNLSIPNNNMNIILYDAENNLIDYAGNGESCTDFGGYNENKSGGIKKSISRKIAPGDGKLKENWFTSFSQQNIKNEYDFLLYNCATPGSDNYNDSSKYSTMDIIFSEICWSGTNYSYADEWMELYNNTENEINLLGWVITGDFNIHLSGLLKPGEYYLLERTDDNSVPGLKSDKIYTGNLKNSGGNLILNYSENNIIDSFTGSPWPAGSNSPKLTMERINYTKPGSPENWKNGLGDIEGAGR